MGMEDHAMDEAAPKGPLFRHVTRLQSERARGSDPRGRTLADRPSETTVWLSNRGGDVFSFVLLSRA